MSNYVQTLISTLSEASTARRLPRFDTHRHQPGTNAPSRPSTGTIPGPHTTMTTTTETIRMESSVNGIEQQTSTRRDVDPAAHSSLAAHSQHDERGVVQGRFIHELHGPRAPDHDHRDWHRQSCR